MAIGWSVVGDTAFALTTGAKTALMAIAPSGFGLKLVEFGVSFDGITSSAVPAAVMIVRSTQATTGTSGVSPVVTQIRGRSSSSGAPTAGSNYTAEPTVLTDVKVLYVPQFNGLYTFQFPLEREIECDSSGGTVKALGIRINVSANVNALCYMEVEAVG